MIRSSVLLLGLFAITASSTNMEFNDILKGNSRDLGQLLDMVNHGPLCEGRTHSCTSEPPWSLTYCCTLSEWMLNNGLWIATVPLIIGLIVLVIIIICCCWCKKSRARL